ncbi:hypothetical protein KSP40_PGU018166 [Platanthera guangdongensis]|uniref:Uncharacterized protein n=1 Tax=Platanthera guangdongensis TaxID=2320717 RepID=A0ABR2MLR3_9ASPA
MGPKSMPMDEFMSHGLPLLDRDVGERIEVAASKGNVLRYVCVVEGSRYFSVYIYVNDPN